MLVAFSVKIHDYLYQPGDLLLALLLVGVQFKTGSLLKSLHTLDRKLTVTSTTSLRGMNPPISQVKA